MSEFTDLALEIQRDTGLDFDAAYRLAWEQMGALLNDVMTDSRWVPTRIILFDLMTVQEMIDFTGGSK